jgi:hypothetical protein
LHKIYIMDYDYNTTRKKLVLPEYGRNVHKMVDFACTIEDRDERNKAARTIISIMGNLNPHLRDIADFKHKLWDHLALISNFQLDIDSPYETITKEALTTKPNSLSYTQDNIRYKHYGKYMEWMINKAAEMEEGEEKESLIRLLANHMKKSYLTWNREVVNDEQIFLDLKELSKGRIDVQVEALKLSETRDILSKNRKKVRSPQPKKKLS